MKKRIQFGLIALVVVAGLVYMTARSMRPASNPVDCETAANRDQLSSTASSISTDSASSAPTAASPAGCAIPAQ